MNLRVALGMWAGLLAVGCSELPEPAFRAQAHARLLVADLRTALARAAEASERAVMADSEAASVQAIRQAEAARAEVERGAAAVVATLGDGEAARLAQDFQARFAEYRVLDETILGLAVENTNLAAQRLSFGPGREAADAFRAAVEAVAGAAPGCEAETQALRAVLAVREIQALQGPHIAEPEDAVMNRLEAEMSARAATARQALTTLRGLVGEARLATASAALERFLGVSAQIVPLSRRNSNVRSLAMSLGQKLAVTAACQASLDALVAELEREGSHATR